MLYQMLLFLQEQLTQSSVQIFKNISDFQFFNLNLQNNNNKINHINLLQQITKYLKNEKL